MKKLFVNFTNHPSACWDVKQKNASETYGEIIDMPFPAVNPKADKEEILNVTEEYAKKIKSMEPEAVLCQGEFSLTYQMVRKLQEEGILVLTACSERRVVERDGKKIVEFIFERYREY